MLERLYSILFSQIINPIMRPVDKVHDVLQERVDKVVEVGMKIIPEKMKEVQTDVPTGYLRELANEAIKKRERMIFIIIQIIIALTSVLSLWLVSKEDSKKKLIGFLITILSQPFWIYTTLISKEYGVLLSGILYVYVGVNGIIKILKDNKDSWKILK